MARLVPARRRGFTLVLEGGTALSSRVDPVTEGERLAAGASLAPGEMLIVFGLSPLYHLRALARKHPDLQGRLWVVEAQAELRRDSASLLEEANREGDAGGKVDLAQARIIAPDEMATLFQALDGAAVAPEQMRLLGNPALESASPSCREAYGAAREKLSGWLSDRVKNRITDRYFSGRWLRSARANAKTDARALLSGQARSSGTALLISSGPSTETGLTNLAQASREHFTMALPGCAALLSRSGVRVDAFISTDGGYWNTCHFDSVSRFYPGATLFCPFSIYPSIPRGPLKPVFFFDDEAWGKEYATTPGRALEVAENWIPQAGTASATALSILRRLGFTAILTAGIDFSLTPWRSHASSNITEERFFSSCRRLTPFDTLYHRAFSLSLLRSGAVWSDEKLELYARLFQRQADLEGLSVRPLAGIC